MVKIRRFGYILLIFITLLAISKTLPLKSDVFSGDGILQINNDYVSPVEEDLADITIIWLNANPGVLSGSRVKITSNSGNSIYSSVCTNTGTHYPSDSCSYTFSKSNFIYETYSVVTENEGLWGYEQYDDTWTLNIVSLSTEYRYDSDPPGISYDTQFIPGPTPEVSFGAVQGIEITRDHSNYKDKPEQYQLFISYAQSFATCPDICTEYNYITQVWIKIKITGSGLFESNYNKAWSGAVLADGSLSASFNAYFSINFDPLNEIDWFSGDYSIQAWVWFAVSPANVPDQNLISTEGFPLALNSWTITGSTNSPPDNPSKPIGPTDGYSRLPYTFSFTGSDINIDNLKFVINWGDGSPLTETSYFSNTQGSIMKSFSHTYSEVVTSTTYLIKFYVIDDEDLSSSYSPTHAFTAHPYAP
jgi:hypothetical protein